MFATTAQLRRAYGLPKALAREIVTEGMQRALRRRWQPWARLFAWLMLPVLAVGVGSHSTWHALHGPYALAAVAVGCSGWASLAWWLGCETILAAAAEKARRLGCRGSAG